MRTQVVFAVICLAAGSLFPNVSIASGDGSEGYDWHSCPATGTAGSGMFICQDGNLVVVDGDATFGSIHAWLKKHHDDEHHASK